VLNLFDQGGFAIAPGGKDHHIGIALGIGNQCGNFSAAIAESRRFCDDLQAERILHGNLFLIIQFELLNKGYCKAIK
jgi:hypothetical protein